MREGDLKAQGLRMADMPFGDLEATLSELAGAGLTRTLLDRLRTDRAFRYGAVAYLEEGHDKAQVAEKREKEKAEQWKHRHCFDKSGSVRDDEQLEAFCMRAGKKHGHERFFYIAGFSLAHSLVVKGDGSGGTVLSKEDAVRLKELLPASKPMSGKEEMGTLAGHLLLSSCHAGLDALFGPNPLKAFLGGRRRDGLSYEAHQKIREQYTEVALRDPVLFLEILAVDFCKVLWEEGSAELREAIKEPRWFSQGIFKHDWAPGSPELEVGAVLNSFCHEVGQWVGEQNIFPDPQPYYSLTRCCRRMVKLGNRFSEKRHNLFGSLAKGLYMTKEPPDPKDERKYYFHSCPFCKKPLYVPPTARESYEASQGAIQFGIYRD